MNVMARYSHPQERTLIYSCAVLVSVLISLWFSFSTTVINRDAICYLQSAYMIGSEGIHQAMHLCGQAKWPFYSFLIFSVTSITHFTYQSSANILDGLFSVVTVMTFLYLVRLLGGTTRTLWYAALVILFAHEFNAVREYIIRDHGFWAFYLISIAALIHFFRSRQFFYALAWWMSLVLATLFRIEGAVFLLGLPLLAFFLVGGRIKAFCQLAGMSLFAGFMIIVFFIHENNELGRLTELVTQMQQGLHIIVAQYQTMKISFAQHVLNTYSAKDAGLLSLVFMMAWYLQNVVANLSVIYTGLVLYAWKRNILRLTRPDKLVLFGYVLINVIITFAFLAENFFLSKRYLIALSLVWMLWVPFALEYVLERGAISRWLKAMVILLILIFAIGGIFHYDASKSYLRDAGQWLAVHTQSNTRIYSNDEQVMYYSHHYGNTIFQEARTDADLQMLAAGKWKQYDYLALRLSKQDAINNAIVKEVNVLPVQVFAGRHGDQVIIYQVSR